MWTLGAATTKTGFARFLPPASKPKIVRDLAGLPASLGRVGDLELRLATTAREIRKAQEVRYRVFFEEGGALPDRTAQVMRRDVCRFDRVCDHLVVVDHATGRDKVVGTYRLLRQDVAEANFGFYSAGEFDIAPLVARRPGVRLLELGRSCVLSEYRSKRTIELLWRGISTYVRHHGVDAMIGCASLPGTDLAALSLALGFLRLRAAAPAEWRVEALPGRGIDLAAMAARPFDERRAVASLPPLIKGYLRCGATFGPSAVIDHRFGTTDLFAVMPVAEIDQRYLAYFAPGSESAAA